jgi:hypothetical protein
MDSAEKNVPEKPKVERDPRDYGFSTELREADERQAAWAEQRRTRGFDDTETWALDAVIAKFLIPRLKRFKELHFCHPPQISMEQWDEILQKMIDGFEESLTRDDLTEKRGREWDSTKVEEGLKLFAEWYHDLWS